MRSRSGYAIAAILSIAVSVTQAQVAQQGSAPPAGTLALANINAAARDALFASFEANANWHFMAAYELAGKALSLDSTFALARIVRENERADGAAIASAEFQRAIRDMSARPIPEITFGLASIATGVNASRLFAAAAAMYPNDRNVAFEYAQSLAGQERLDALRAVAVKYPDFVAPRAWYAYWVTNLYFSSLTPPVVDDATRMAMEAIRLAPAQSAGHMALAHVLVHAGRRDEALPHVLQAIKLDPLAEYAHYLAGEIYIYDGKPNAIDRARTAFDSAALTSPSLVRQSNDQRDRAVMLVQDGRVQQMETELLAIAAAAERRSAPAAAAGAYQDLAVLFAGTRDTARVTRYTAEAHRVLPTLNPEVEVDALAIARMPVEARAALDAYVKGAPNPMSAATATVAKRLAATVAYAEGKYDQALADCTDVNPYCDLVKVESLFALGRTREAEAMRTAFFAKKDASAESRAEAIMRYRAAHPR